MPADTLTTPGLQSSFMYSTWQHNNAKTSETNRKYEDTA